MAIIQNDIDIAQSYGDPDDELPALLILQDNKQAEIDSKQSEIDIIQGYIDDLEDEVSALGTILATENNFTQAQIEELNPYIIEKIVTNGDIAIVADLWEWGLNQFIKINTPDLVFSITLANFLQFLDPASLIDASEFGLGSLGDDILVVRNDFGVNTKAKITEIKISYESSEMSFVLTDIQSINRDKDKLLKLIKNINMTSTTVNMNKYKWNSSYTTANSVQSILDEAWDATARAINAGVEQSVSLDARGLTCFPLNDPSKLIRITNGAMGFSDDGGRTYKVAIDSTGVYAPRLVGQILLGENLYIDTSSGIFSVNETGVTIDGTALLITNTESTPPAGSLNYMLQALESQIGGSVTKWFGDYIPTLINQPAVGWTTDELKTAHLGDLFYYTATPNKQYRFSNYAATPTSFYWFLTTDTNNPVNFDYTYSNQIRIDTVDGIIVNKLDGWGDIKSRTIMNGTDGFAIQKNLGTNESPDWDTQFYVDTSGDIIMSGKIVRGDLGSGEVFRADDSGIYLGSNDFLDAPFRVTMAGKLYAENAEIRGSVDCSALLLNGEDILNEVGNMIDDSKIDLKKQTILDLGLNNGEIIEYKQTNWSAGDMSFTFSNKYHDPPCYVVFPPCTTSRHQDVNGYYDGVFIPGWGHEASSGTVFNLIAVCKNKVVPATP
jgi:hypothetical protein